MWTRLLRVHAATSRQLSVSLQGEHGLALNDFEALALSLPMLDPSELHRIGGGSPKEHAAKVVLANEVTKLVRGEKAARTAEATAAETFAGGAGEDLPTLALEEGMTITAALTAIGFAASNGEAKRKIAEGAVRLDDVVVSDAGMVISSRGKLSLGRTKHALLVP